MVQNYYQCRRPPEFEHYPGEWIILNPVSGMLHLQLAGNGPQLTSYSLNDAYGRQLLKASDLPKTQSGESLNIDVQKYPAGIYNIKLTDVNGNNISKEFIIIK